MNFGAKMNKLNYYQLNQIEHLWRDLLVNIKNSRVEMLLTQKLVIITYEQNSHIRFIEHHSPNFKYLLEDLIGLYFDDSLPHFDLSGHVLIQASHTDIKGDVNHFLDIINDYLEGKDGPITKIRLNG